jgi:hypothetical protein
MVINSLLRGTEKKISGTYPAAQPSAGKALSAQQYGKPVKSWGYRLRLGPFCASRIMAFTYLVAH